MSEEYDIHGHRLKADRKIEVEPKPAGINPKDQIGAAKPPMHLLPGAALVEMAMVMGEGARKYGPHNWREPGKAVQSQTYTSAAIRHILAYQDGEDIDPESGRPHLALAMAGLGILIDAKACGNCVDNRPAPAPTAQMIREFSSAAINLAVNVVHVPQAFPYAKGERDPVPVSQSEVVTVLPGSVTNIDLLIPSKKWEDHLERLIRQELNAYPAAATMGTRKLADLIHAAWKKETNEITGIEPIVDALRLLKEKHPLYDNSQGRWISLGPSGAPVARPA